MMVCLPVRVTLNRHPLMAHMQGHTDVTTSQNILENTGNLQCSDFPLLQYQSSWPAYLFFFSFPWY